MPESVIRLVWFWTVSWRGRDHINQMLPST